MVDITCANCGHENQAGSNFCSSCGQPLPRDVDEPRTITFAIDMSGTSEEVEIDASAVDTGGVLIATRGPNSGSQFKLEHVITTAGRHPDSDIFLDDVTVSRRHVEIERTTDGYVVRDVGSLNGTYVNHRLINSDTPLTNGDELQVGRFKLVFIAGER